MKNTVEHILNTKSKPVFNAYLAERIKAEIALLEERRRVRHAIVTSLFSVGSFVATVYTGIVTYRSIAASRVTEFTSLIYSDTSVFFTFWKEALYAIIESIPVMSVIAFLLLAGCFVWSLAKTLEQTKIRSIIKLA